MRRIRRLDVCDYIIALGQKTKQLITFSNHNNVLLERTWHKRSSDKARLSVHARFNSVDFDGVNVFASLMIDNDYISSVVNEIRIYRVNDSDWSETFITSAVPVQSIPNVFSTSFTQIQLGSNELTGSEVYSIEADAVRRRDKFSTKVWFNHLGVFDTLDRLRRRVDFLDITKLDE